MAGATLLTLIDDIASLLDDVAVLSKVAAKKTSAVVADDLALNAKQVTGLAAAREWPIIWAVAKGSFVNKLILVPIALALSLFAPFLVLPFLLLGGLYLCYEGFEKVWHGGRAPHKPKPDTIDESVRIKGAIRTDFILSAEVIVIALSTVAEAALPTRIGVLVVVALAMTIGVYGLVAAIVKLDDAGLYLAGRPGAVRQGIGRALVFSAPRLMRGLSVFGVLAMFAVGGGIVVHAWPWLDAVIHVTLPALMPWPAAGVIAAYAMAMGVGLASGALVVVVLQLATRVRTALFDRRNP